jgi:hypothetical protein
VYNPPPGWDEELVSWQAENVGWTPPTAGWTPPSVPNALPAPEGWQFWVPNPMLIARARNGFLKKALTSIGVGIALVVVGVAASIVSQNLAASGGIVIIFTGLMIVGLCQIIFGLIRLFRAPAMAKASVTANRI